MKDVSTKWWRKYVVKTVLLKKQGETTDWFPSSKSQKNIKILRYIFSGILVNINFSKYFISSIIFSCFSFILRCKITYLYIYRIIIKKKKFRNDIKKWFSASIRNEAETNITCTWKFHIDRRFAHLMITTQIKFIIS